MLYSISQKSCTTFYYSFSVCWYRIFDFILFIICLVSLSTLYCIWLNFVLLFWFFHTFKSLFIYYSHHLFVIFIIYLLFYHIGLYVKKGILKEYKTDFGVVPNLVKLFQHLYGTISVRNLIIDIFFSNSFQNN